MAEFFLAINPENLVLIMVGVGKDQRYKVARCTLPKSVNKNKKQKQTNKIGDKNNMKRKVMMIRSEESKHMHAIPYISLRLSFTCHGNDIVSTSTTKVWLEREQIRTKKMFSFVVVSPKFLFSPSHTVLSLSTPTTSTTHSHSLNHGARRCCFR